MIRNYKSGPSPFGEEQQCTNSANWSEIGDLKYHFTPWSLRRSIMNFVSYTNTGLVLAVLTGITLGIAMGMILLVTVHCARYRY